MVSRASPRTYPPPLPNRTDLTVLDLWAVHLARMVGAEARDSLRPWLSALHREYVLLPPYHIKLPG